VTPAPTTLAAGAVTIPAVGTHAVTFSAVLTSLATTRGAAGQPVVLTLGGAGGPTCAARAHGLAHCTMTVTGPGAGSYTASFAGSLDYGSSTVTAPA